MHAKPIRLVMTGLFSALCCVATMMIRIPSPVGGYINAGDAVVLLGAFFLGPIAGGIAAGLGSALADALAGYMVYVPATFIIKFLMAFLAALIFRQLQKKSVSAAVMIGGIAAEVIMIAGYFAFTALILGLGWGALPEIPGNVAQGVFGIAAAAVLRAALWRVPYVRQHLS